MVFYSVLKLGVNLKAAIVPSLKGRWEVREVPTPRPGPNEVLIKIRASGLCYTDVHITRGNLGAVEFPRTLGHEPVGDIVALGAGVVNRQVGDRVGVPWVQASCGRCEWCLRSKPMFCDKGIGTGLQTQGSHAEYMLAFADATMIIPDKLSYEQAAPIFCAGYTVYSGLRWAKPQPHERVAVVGIGGLGHLALQYSKACGFETIAVTHSRDKEKSIKDLGADAIVTNANELSKEGGADVMLVTSNSYKLAVECLQGMRPDGRVIIMGIAEEPMLLRGNDLVNKRLHVIGSMQNDREYLYEALDLVARGKVKVITETYKLDDIGKAYERVEAGKVRYRAVITN
jgi:alcohol dehydrogenase